MKVVLQRVSSATVTVSGEVVGQIGRGCLLLAGFRDGDNNDRLSWMAEKVLGLRVFPDDSGKMNLSLEDVSGDLLIVSQFTLYGNTNKGRRPSFVGAAPSEVARGLYEQFVDLMRGRTGGCVETGDFGAHMDVALVNDGPVTLILERK